MADTPPGRIHDFPSPLRAALRSLKPGEYLYCQWFPADGGQKQSMSIDYHPDFAVAETAAAEAGFLTHAFAAEWSAGYGTCRTQVRERGGSSYKGAGPEGGASFFYMPAPPSSSAGGSAGGELAEDPMQLFGAGMQFLAELRSTMAEARATMAAMPAAGSSSSSSSSSAEAGGIAPEVEEAEAEIAQALEYLYSAGMRPEDLPPELRTKVVAFLRSKGVPVPD